VLKKCKKPDDVLFINVAEHFEMGRRQNQLRPEYIALRQYGDCGRGSRSGAVHERLVEIENEITEARKKHNGFLRELGLPQLPGAGE
jgi:type I restriction enzyme M protein